MVTTSMLNRCLAKPFWLYLDTMIFSKPNFSRFGNALFHPVHSSYFTTQSYLAGKTNAMWDGHIFVRRQERTEHRQVNSRVFYF